MSVIGIIVFLIGLPISVFFSVKFGRYGYLKATELFEQRQKKQSTQK